MEELLTAVQLAAKTKISISYVYKHWEELGGFRVGRNVRFLWEDTIGRLLCSRKGMEIPAKIQKKRYTGAYFKSKRDALKAESDRRDQLKNPQPDPAQKTIETPITFLELINKRLSYVQVYHTTRHYDDYRYMARRWVRLWGEIPCAEITSEDIRNFVIRRSAKSSAGTGNKEITYLRSTFRWGIECGLIPADPTRGIKFFPLDKKIKYIPPKEDVWKVLIAADKNVQDYLMVLKDTMARMSEINQLCWDDISLQERSIILYTRKKKGGHRTPRKVPMTAKLFEVLSRRFKERRKDIHFVFWHTYWSSKTGERKEGPYTDRKRIMTTLCKRAGVKYFRFHALRHLGASMLADAGVTIDPIQKILGHQNRSTTEIYLHSLGEAERRAMDVLEKDGDDMKDNGKESEKSGNDLR